MVTTKFINECKNRANGNRLGKIVLENTLQEITNRDNLQSFTIDDSCYVDGNIIGTTYIKKITGNFVSVPDDVDLINKKIHALVGVKYADNSTEYVELGKYTIERPKEEQTAGFGSITAYDDLINNLDKPYVCNIDFSELDSEGNIITKTIKDFYIDICDQLGLSPKTTTFLNNDIPIIGNPFTNKGKNRFVLSEIEKVACSYVDLDYEKNEIDLVWLSESKDPDYIFETNDYTTLEGGKIIYGPVNKVIIKESQIEGEETTRKDDESLLTDEETCITIADSYFLYSEELRELAIDNIWNRIKGLTYIDCKLTTEYGKPFLKKGAKIRINVNDGRIVDTYVLKHQFTYDGTFKSIIESPVLTKEEIKTKNQESLPEKVRRVEQVTNKVEGKIIDVLEQVDGQEIKLNQTIRNVDSIHTTVSNKADRDEVNNGYSDLSENIDVIRHQQTELTQTTTDLKFKITDIENNGVSKVKNTMVTIDIDGLKVSVDTDAFSSLLNNKGVFLYRYNKEIGKFTPEQSELDNMIIRNYLVVGYHRSEKFQKNTKKRTGVFWDGDKS